MKPNINRRHALVLATILACCISTSHGTWLFGGFRVAGGHAGRFFGYGGGYYGPRYYPRQPGYSGCGYGNRCNGCYGGYGCTRPCTYGGGCFGILRPIDYATTGIYLRPYIIGTIGGQGGYGVLTPGQVGGGGYGVVTSGSGGGGYGVVGGGGGGYGVVSGGGGGYGVVTTGGGGGGGYGVVTSGGGGGGYGVVTSGGGGGGYGVVNSGGGGGGYGIVNNGGVGVGPGGSTVFGVQPTIPVSGVTYGQVPQTYGVTSGFQPGTLSGGSGGVVTVSRPIGVTSISRYPASRVNSLPVISTAGLGGGGYLLQPSLGYNTYGSGQQVLGVPSVNRCIGGACNFGGSRVVVPATRHVGCIRGYRGCG